MKTLQNNFTTPEQSKRLLELGIPADSADCYYSRMQHEEFENPRVCYMPYFNHTLFHPKTFIYLPCWTVGRLMEILMICNTYFAPKEFKIAPNSMNPTLIENVVNKIEELEGYDMLDFSKLEE